MSVIKHVQDFEFREDPGDPWIARFHHEDAYPAGDGDQGVKKEDLQGHNIGEDLDESLDFRMYYGDRIPGFPVHSHRGFETITIVLEGVIDHFDSHGNHGRYMAGDVQWMTAGNGIRHTELFPLVNDQKENPTELFQIWLTLPSWNKLVDCDYKMLWKEDIPIVEKEGTRVSVIQGEFNGTQGLQATNSSWASDERSKLRILNISMEKGSSLDINQVSETLNRNLYLYHGEAIEIDGEEIRGKKSIKLEGNADIKIEAKDDVKLLLLEAEPLNEPILNDGPMVMNTEEEVLQGYRDFWDNQYGGWPWKEASPVHDKEEGRFSAVVDRPNTEKD